MFKHFKDSKNQVFSLEVDALSEGRKYLPEDAVEITHEEMLQLTAPPLSEVEAAVKNYRNGLLAACDWTQIPDADLTTTERNAWKAYRKALRDVTDQPGFPTNVTWPTAPN